MRSYVRAVRWFVWAADVVCCVMFAVIQFSTRKSHHEALPWVVGMILFSTLNVVLLTAENRHKQKQIVS